MFGDSLKNFLRIAVVCILWLIGAGAWALDSCDGLTRTTDSPVQVLGELFLGAAEMSINEKRCLKNLEFKNFYLVQDESYFHDGSGDDRYRKEGSELSTWSVLDSGIVETDQLFIQQSLDGDLGDRESKRDSLETLTGYSTTGSSSQPD